MVSRYKINREREWLSDRISTQTRWLTLTLLGVTWGVLIAERGTKTPVPIASNESLLLVGTLCLTAMVLDFLQYCAGYLNAVSLLEKMKRDGVEEVNVNRHSPTYILRALFFVAKQLFIAAAYIVFLFSIIPFLTQVA
jgi:hypothetical protein